MRGFLFRMTGCPWSQMSPPEQDDECCNSRMCAAAAGKQDATPPL